MKLNITLLFCFFCSCTLHTLANHAQIDSLIKVLETEEDRREKFEVALTISGLYYKGTEAEKYYQIAEQQALFLNNDTLIATVFMKKAWLCYTRSQIDSSQYYLEKALEINKAIQYNKGTADVYSLSGIIFSDFGKYDSGEEMYKKALEYARKVKEKQHIRLITVIYNNYGVLLYKANKGKEAQKILKKALPYLDTLNNQLQSGRIYYNLGRAYQIDKQYNLAIKYLLQSHNYRLLEVNQSARGEPFCNLGETMIEMLIAKADTNQFAAIYATIKTNSIPEILDSAFYLAKVGNSLNLQGRILSARIKYHVYKNDYKRAFADTRTYNSIREAYLLSEENLEGLQSLQDKLEQQRLENEVLKTNLKQKQTANQRNILGLAILALGLLTFLGYLLLQQRIKARQAKLDLEVQKNEILKNRQQIIAVNATLEGQEQERARIAKDLHDGLGTLLTTVKRSISSDNDAILLLDEAYSEVRRIAHNMMPLALKQLGLKEALDDLSKKIDDTNDFEVTFQVYGSEQSLDENKEIMLYRSIQEAFTNIQKYANAKEVFLQMTYGDKWLNISIEDDGKGFDKSSLTTKNGLGLHSIVSRVEYIDGECLIESQEGEGTSISITVPV